MTFANYAEQMAAEATTLTAFHGINLHSVRAFTSTVLSKIGSSGMFESYTLHDISHIDALLKSLDWIIPEDTKSSLTKAEWLLITLSMYFHDMGMLVTRSEFDARYDSEFSQFRDLQLASGAEDTDFGRRLASFDDDDRESFLYQEFVRTNHGTRAKHWISGSPHSHLGLSDVIAGEISTLLGPLDGQFRDDLASICESHHRDDLSDTAKYPVRQVYGSHRDEVANIQYVAVLLRTADLFHITSDRTPSVAYRLIDPIDPSSQRAWTKHKSVRAVMPLSASVSTQSGTGAQQASTISVYATFNDPDAFFGLVAYLQYAESQLQQSADWVARSRIQHGVSHDFPWRCIDTTSIRTRGFLPEQLRFTLDHSRILELLTGHTLYNDISVAVRELVQNGIDAVRLQSLMSASHGLSSVEGQVDIEWSPSARKLVIRDNGTGMSLTTIRQHFLSVGSSRYKSEEVQKSYPNFSSISRFGIGVLTAFMVSDNIEVKTLSATEDDAIHLSLRGVHGQYLVRTISKHDSDVSTVYPHGTEITLEVRPSADIDAIVSILQRWIVIPGCKVFASVEEEETLRIGFDSTQLAIEAYLTKTSPSRVTTDARRRIRVVTKQHEGLALSFATQYNELFGVWELLTVIPSREGETRPIGFCVEGVRVSGDAPGFDGSKFLALVNATGPTAPSTNVARSALERTPEYDRTNALVYQMLCDFITEQVQLLLASGKSQSWAANEAQHLCNAFKQTRLVYDDDDDVGEGSPLDANSLWDAIGTIPVCVVEQESQRRLISCQELRALDAFWTVTWTTLTSAENMLRDGSFGASVGDLLRALGAESTLPCGSVLCNPPSDVVFRNLVFNGVDPSRIIVDRELRRVDREWRQRDRSRWWNLAESLATSGPTPLPGQTRIRISGSDMSIWVELEAGTISGLTAESGVVLPNSIYFRHDSAAGQLLISLAEQCQDIPARDGLSIMAMAAQVTSTLALRRGSSARSGLPYIERLLTSERYYGAPVREFSSATAMELLRQYDVQDTFISLAECEWDMFNPLAWVREGLHFP